MATPTPPEVEVKLLDCQKSRTCKFQFLAVVLEPGEDADAIIQQMHLMKRDRCAESIVRCTVAVLDLGTAATPETPALRVPPPSPTARLAPAPLVHPALVELRSLLTEMKDKVKDAEAQARGCDAVARIACREDAQSLVWTEGDIQPVLDAMLSYPGSVDVQMNGCRAVVHITAHPKSPQLAVGTITVWVELVVAAMQTYPSHADVQHYGCWALANIATNPDNQALVARVAGAIDAAVHAMGSHLENEHVQHRGCLMLGNIAERMGNHPIAAKVGVIQAVVHAMQSHAGNQEVQGNGCNVLALMSKHPECQALAAKAGGIEAILNAMRTFQAIVDVQAIGCAALLGILTNDSDRRVHAMGLPSVNAENQALATKAGGIEAIVRAMQIFPDSVELQSLCIVTLALGFAFDNAENQMHVAKAGGMEAVVSALRTHAGNADFQGMGGFAILCLAVHPMNRPVIARLGGVETMRRARAAHMHNTSLAGVFEGALGVLGTDKNIRKVLTASEIEAGVRNLVKGFEREPYIENHLLDFCMLPLAEYAQDPACHPQLISCALVSRVAEAIFDHTSSGRVQLCGVRTLCDLARGSDVGRKAVVAALPAIGGALSSAGDVLCGGGKGTIGLSESQLRDGAEMIQILFGLEEGGRMKKEFEERMQKEKAKRKAEEALAALLQGVNISSSSLAILITNKVTSRAALVGATATDLVAMGILYGEAFEIKALFKDKDKDDSAGSGGAAAPPSIEQKLHALLAGLDITPKTFTILAQNEYISASALRLATIEKLEALGVAPGQAAELKSKFFQHDHGHDGGAAASSAAPGISLQSMVHAGLMAQGDAAASAAPAPSPLSSSSSTLRLLDALELPTASQLPPIFGVMDIAPQPLVDTLDGLVAAGVQGLPRAAALANHRVTERFKRTPAATCNPHDLTTDEAAALFLYTMEFHGTGPSVYTVINAALRSEDRNQVSPYKHYLRLLLGGLGKLPKVAVTVHRGVAAHLGPEYKTKTGQTVIWWAVSSATRNVAVLSSKAYLGNITAGVKRTKFTIEAVAAVDIRQYSATFVEEEMVLLPGAELEVVGAYQGSEDLWEVQLKEVDNGGFPLVS